MQLRRIRVQERRELAYSQSEPSEYVRLPECLVMKQERKKEEISISLNPVYFTEETFK